MCGFMDRDDGLIAEYHASRARYIRSVTADVEERLMASVEKRRAPLLAEINNLTVLGRDRYDTYRAGVAAYKATTGAKSAGFTEGRAQSRCRV